MVQLDHRRRNFHDYLKSCCDSQMEMTNIEDSERCWHNLNHHFQPHLPSLNLSWRALFPPWRHVNAPPKQEEHCDSNFTRFCAHVFRALVFLQIFFNSFSEIYTHESIIWDQNKRIFFFHESPPLTRDVLLLHDNRCNLRRVQIWLVTSSFCRGNDGCSVIRPFFSAKGVACETRLRPGNTCCPILCAPRPLGQPAAVKQCFTNPTFSSQSLYFHASGQEIWCRNFVHTLFQFIRPTITFSMPCGICSHHNFSVRASCAEWELLKWATLRQYKSVFHKLFTKSFVTALILTGSTWLQFFVRSYSIWKSLIYLKKATTINSRDEKTTCTQAAESRHLAEF